MYTTDNRPGLYLKWAILDMLHWQSPAARVLLEAIRLRELRLSSDAVEVVLSPIVALTRPLLRLFRSRYLWRGARLGAYFDRRQ